MKTNLILTAVLAGLVTGWFDNTPPPSRTPALAPGEGNTRVVEAPRPVQLPDESYIPPPAFNDVPLVNQRPPEQRAFVDAYNRVGRPRITLFVNRTLDGNIIPANPRRPNLSVEETRTATTGVTVDKSENWGYGNYYGGGGGQSNDRFESTGPGEYRQSVDVYLKHGEYDEVQARDLDYVAIENVMTDWIASNGQVTVVSPTLVRQKLTDEQVKALEEGRPQVMREIAEQLDADVLVQVQARPTRQTGQGLEVRLVVEAMNVRGGESLARVIVDMAPPLDKTTINKYTRFLARSLMDDMTETWTPPVPAGQPTTRPTAP
jgi:hypothetical protein